MPKKGKHAKRGTATAAADDQLAGAPQRLKKAINRLLSRSPLKSRKSLVLDIFSNLVDLSEDWETRYSGCHASRLDGNEDADAEEEALARLCDAVQGLPDPESAFVELFGDTAAKLVKQMIICHENTWPGHKGFKIEHKTHGGRGLDEGDDGIGGEDEDNEDEDDDASGRIAQDMRTPFARQLRKALDDSKKLSPAVKPTVGGAKTPTLTPSLGPKALVKLFDLKSRPELNGEMALVIRKQEDCLGLGPDDERWVVMLASSPGNHTNRVELALKRKNLVVQEGFEKQRVDISTGIPIPNISNVQEAYKSLEILQTALRPKKPPSPSKQLRRLIREAVLRQGNMRFMTYFSERSKRSIASGEILILQIEAAEVVHYSKSRNWKRNPDALWLRGSAHFLRNMMSEAANDLSAALACKPEKWIMPFRELAETVLTMSRRGLPPCLGRWEEIFGPNRVDLVLEPGAQPPGRRVGPASCTANGQLFLFGGLRPKTTDATMQRCLLFSLSHMDEEMDTAAGGVDQRPLADFYAYNLSTKQWRHLSEGPGPRGFGLLSHDPATNCLYLFSGREIWQTYSPSNYVNDIWKYDISKDAWSKLEGACAPPARQVELAAHCVYQGNWFVLDTPSEFSESAPDETPLPVELWRFDLAQKKWHAVKCTSPVPRMGRPATAWEQDGKMFVWSEGKAMGNKTVTLWAVDLRPKTIGTWTPYTIMGGPGRERFKGAFSAAWREGASYFDPVARKAYLFGGWTQDLNFGSVEPETGGPIMLTGRYFSLLLEINVDALEMRVVEGIPTERDYCQGPEERAQAMVTSFTTLGGGSGKDGGGGPHTTVTVGFGYTTFEVTTGLYSNLRSFGDVWECRLLNGAESTAHAAQTDRWGFKPGESSVEREQKSSGGSAAAEVSRAVHVARNTQAELRSFDPDAHFNYLKAQIANDVETRKFLTNLAPTNRGCGAFVANMLDKDRQGLPVTAETFFTASYLSEWLTATQVRLRFSNLKQVEPHADSILDKDPKQNVVLICVAAENIPGESQVNRIQLSDGDDYLLMGGSFARYHPMAIYLSQAHKTETGELRESRDVDGRMGVSQVGAALACNGVIDICSNKESCPNAEARIKAGSDASMAGQDVAEVLRKFGKLKECSRCKLVKYCGPECQRAHWPSHKAECKKAAASSGK